MQPIGGSDKRADMSSTERGKEILPFVPPEKQPRFARVFKQGTRAVIFYGSSGRNGPTICTSVADAAKLLSALGYDTSPMKGKPVRRHGIRCEKKPQEAS